MKSLLIRSISGVVFLAIVVGCILGGSFSYTCMMGLIIGVMLGEFYRMAFGKKYLLIAIGIACGIILFTVFYMLGNEGYAQTVKGASEPAYLLVFIDTFMAIAIACLILLWTGLLIQQLYQKSEKPFNYIAYTVLGVLYVVLPWAIFSFTVMLNGYDRYLALSLFILLWSSDVGAYVFGMLFGRHGKHKLFPSVSPKKTWEGYFGGLLTALGAGCLLHHFDFITFGIVHVLVIAALIHVFGVFGDLVESMLKRSAGVKDSGKIMPGHGGLLDRFDAALIAFPVVSLYIFFFYFYS